MGAAAHLQVFVLLQAMDLGSTLLGLRAGAHEANPGALGVLDWGWPALVAVKLAFLALVGALLVLHGGPAWSTFVHGLNILYGAIVGWNLAVLTGGPTWPAAGIGAVLVGVLPTLPTLGSRVYQVGTRLPIWLTHGRRVRGR